MRGQQSEPIELRPGTNAANAARIAAAERWARGRVRSIKLFYSHLTIFSICNFALILIDASTPGDPWFYKPLLGWGLILGLHAAQAYEMLPWLSQDWEQRRLDDLIRERLRD